MAANRKVSYLAIGTGTLVLLILAVFAWDPERFTAPERSPDAPRPAAKSAAPGVVDPDPPRPAATKTPVAAPAGKPAKDAGRRVPLEVEIIDAETGQTLADARPHLAVGAKGEIALESSGGFFRHPDAAVAAGHRASLTFRVELPDGYALERADGFRVAAVVSRYAERVRVTIPVWRHAMVLVRVMDHANNPVAGAVIRGASIPSGDHKVSALPTDTDGWTRVDGLPALHGESVYVTVQGNSRHRSVKGRIEDGFTPVRLTAVLPERMNGTVIGIGGGAGGAFGGRGDRRRKPKTGRESVVVLVRHRDGRPAVDTLVGVGGGGARAQGRTDAGGRVRLEGLPVGNFSATVCEPGFAMGDPVRFRVTAGEVATATIHEAVDRWIAGVVRSETGRALASARVTVRVRNGPDLVWLDRGLQRLNPLSGPDGRFAFPGVPPGPAVVHAGYASRLASAPARDPGVTTMEFGPKK